MTILTCPTCSKSLKIPDELLGKKVKCSACLATFTAEEPVQKPAERDEERPRRRGSDPDSRIAEEDEDDRPSRRGRDRDRPRGARRRRRDYEPHRGTLILVLGILGLVVFHPLGIVAWIMGNHDLKAMRAGRMDPEGQSQTQTGKVLGIVATCFMIVGCLCAIGY